MSEAQRRYEFAKRNLGMCSPRTHDRILGRLQGVTDRYEGRDISDKLDGELQSSYIDGWLCMDALIPQETPATV